jgi:hypothetical protein
MGTMLNNTGSTRVWTYRFKVGATTVLDSANLSRTSNASRNRFRLVLDFFVESTTAQKTSAYLGVASFSNFVSGIALAGYGTSTEDFATAKDLKLTVELATASADMDCVLEGYYIERIGP